MATQSLIWGKNCNVNMFNWSHIKEGRISFCSKHFAHLSYFLTIVL
jgi:hypothetical protein